MIERLEERVSFLESVVFRMIRVGVVTQTLPERGTVRVRLPDQDGEVSYELPVIVRKSQRDKDYWMPDVGEHVTCVFLPYGPEQGFVVGAFYSEADPVPVADQDVRRVEFENGAFVEWNRRTGELRVFSPGPVVIESGAHMTFKAPRIDLNP